MASNDSEFPYRSEHKKSSGKKKLEQDIYGIFLFRTGHLYKLVIKVEFSALFFFFSLYLHGAFTSITKLPIILQHHRLLFVFTMLINRNIQIYKRMQKFSHNTSLSYFLQSVLIAKKTSIYFLTIMA